MTRAELARLVNCTPDRITKYASEGLPVVKTGGGRGRRTTIDLAAAIQWLLGRRASDAERARYYRIQADRAELDYETKAGKLVVAAEIEAAWSEMAIAIRNKLLSIPSKLKAKRPEASNSLIADVDSEIRSALTELAESSERRQVVA